MVDSNHAEKLQECVKAWNMWRMYNAEIDPDLSGINLEKIKLRRVNFSEVNLESANLKGSNLSRSILSWATFKGRT